MTRTQLAVDQYQQRNRDRYMQRLELPQREFTQAQKLGVVLVCAFLIVVALVSL